MKDYHYVVATLIVIVLILAPFFVEMTGFFSSTVGWSFGVYWCDFNTKNLTNVSDQNMTVGDTFFIDVNHTIAGKIYTYSDDTPLFGIDPVTGVINYTAFSPDVGTHIITITLSGECIPALTNFTLVVNPLPPVVIPPGEGGGTTCQPDLVYGVWGPCLNDMQQRTVTDLNGCREDTTQSRGCAPTGGSSMTCSYDGDCPEGFFCPTAGVCRQETPTSCGDNTCDLNEDCDICPTDCGTCIAELIELPSLPSTEVTPFLNYDIIEYPGYPTELKAIRAGEITPTGMLDLSLYNLYYEEIETPLGIWLRELLIDIYKSFLGK
ncbi:hypothetical protein ACFLZB_03525 [Nanoarchaeota archaeon]